MDPRETAFNALESELGVMMGRARRAVATRAHMLHPDVPSGAYLILGHVAKHGPLRATTVGEVFAIDKGSVSRHVQQLVDLGLLAREPDPVDRRAQLLTATDEGVRRLAEIADARRQPFLDRMGGWTTEDIEELVAGLARYNSSLD